MPPPTRLASNQAWVRDRGWPRPELGLVLLTLALVTKLILELVTGSLAWPLALPPGFRAAPVAHVAGAVAGALCWLAPSW